MWAGCVVSPQSLGNQCTDRSYNLHRWSFCQNGFLQLLHFLHFYCNSQSVIAPISPISLVFVQLVFLPHSYCLVQLYDFINTILVIRVTYDCLHSIITVLYRATPISKKTLLLNVQLLNLYSNLATLLVSFSLFHPWCDVAALSIQCSHASCGGAKFKTGCRERLFCFFAAWSQAVSTRKMCIGRKFAENMKYFLFLDSRCLLVCYSRLLFWINMLPSMDYMTVCLNFCITCIFSIY